MHNTRMLITWFTNPLQTDYKFIPLGGRVFTCSIPFCTVYSQYAEYEQLWYNFEFLESPYLQINDQQPGLFLGGGYRFGAGNSAGLQILACGMHFGIQTTLFIPTPGP